MTKRGAVKRLLRELKEALESIYGEDFRGLYLYGSYARGEEDSESDLDLIIVLKDFEDYWEEVERTGQVIAQLSLKYGVSLSPVRVREREWLRRDTPFLAQVHRECVPV